MSIALVIGLSLILHSTNDIELWSVDFWCITIGILAISIAFDSFGKKLEKKK